MSGDRTPAKAASPQEHAAPHFFVQRKCACGTAMEKLSGECDGCREKHLLGFQAKLEVGGVDDRFERDADRVAGEVTGSVFVSAAASRLRPLDAGSGGLGEAPPIVRQTLATPGAPLDQATRSYFEPRFGHDFSRVTVHADGRADASARAVGAHAYTVGDHIVFASGRFSPATQGGKQLIAHELAHVVQQSGTARVQRQAAPAPVRYSPAMQLDQALKELPNMPPADALAVLKRYQQYIIQSITNGEKRIRAHMELRAEGIINYVIGGTIEVFGGATLPSDDWRDAWREVTAAYDTINAGQIKESLQRLNAASKATERHWEELNEYFDRTDTGVDRSVTTLKGIVVAAVITEAILLPVVLAGGVKPALLSLSLATAPAGTTGAAVAAPTVVVAAPTVAAGSAPVIVGVGAPTVAAVAAPAAATTAAVAAPTVAVTVPAVTSTATTTLAVATTLVATTTISSDTPAPQKEDEKKKRPPFVLRLPRQKAPHLPLYRSWLGTLQSDPSYARGNPGQLELWHQGLRIGGSHGIDYEVYERGHALGLQGEAGERRIRVPDWSRTRRTAMEVDHVIELQVTPAAMRPYFNSMANFELLDRTSNGTAGPLLQANIAAERARQVAFDPSAASRVLRFEDVVLDGGSEAERWSVDEIRRGDQLDVYEEDYYVP